MAPAAFDAIVLAVSPHARAGVAGVSLVERGRRVADKAGATRVKVIERADDAADLATWAAGRDGRALLVIDAGDQLVHTPLVTPLLAGTPSSVRPERSASTASAESKGHPERSASSASAESKGAPAERRLAVDEQGAYAGALWATGAAADEAVAAIAAAPATADRELAARWTDAARVPHGPIARHPATTPAERRAAKRLLFGLIVKGEDGPVSKYVYRPVSRVLTRFLVHTPITPNMVSILVGILGAIGCWFTARGDYQGLWVGAALVLAAGFIDGCDGEIARIKLEFSKIGAWLDTLVDEATTTTYLIAIGLHTHHRLPDAGWVVPSIWIGVVAYLLGICCIYYFLIVVSKTGNSQHYVGRLELAEDAQGPGLRRPPETASTLPPWLRLLGAALSQVIRRDFINLGALCLALADLYYVIYGTMWLGGIVTLCVVGPDHLRLRRQIALLRRRGAGPRLIAR